MIELGGAWFIALGGVGLWELVLIASMILGAVLMFRRFVSAIRSAPSLAKYFKLLTGYGIISAISLAVASGLDYIVPASTPELGVASRGYCGRYRRC
jgi:hypothetical protein